MATRDHGNPFQAKDEWLLLSSNRPHAIGVQILRRVNKWREISFWHFLIEWAFLSDSTAQS